MVDRRFDEIAQPTSVRIVRRENGLYPSFVAELLGLDAGIFAVRPVHRDRQTAEVLN